MTREDARKAAEVMLAYAEGKEIQAKRNGYDNNEWFQCSTPYFDFGNFDFRIKPESKYRPFNNAEECWQEMQKHQPFGWVKDKENGDFSLIDCISNERIVIARKGVLSFDKADERVTFADGSAFGKKDENPY